MNSSDVSVLICTRNRPEALRSCLLSIAKSAERPLEVLVVDQSSNEHSANVVRDLAPMMQACLSYIHPDSVGHTMARNEGIRASRGQIIAFTDDDCIVATGWLEAISREFADPSVRCVCGQTKPADHGDRPRQAFISTLDGDGRKLVRGKHNPIVVGRGNNMAFRKADLLRLGGFNEQIGVGTSVYAGDDIDLFYRFLQGGLSILHSPDVVVFHSQPDDWQAVIRKKRGYSISVAAILASRARQGDLYAAALLVGKMAYEFGFLFCCGLARLNPRVAAIGWHSFLGTLSGLKYARDRRFCREIRRLTDLAHECRICPSPDA